MNNNLEQRIEKLVAALMRTRKNRDEYKSCYQFMHDKWTRTKERKDELRLYKFKIEEAMQIVKLEAQKKLEANKERPLSEAAIEARACISVIEYLQSVQP